MISERWISFFFVMLISETFESERHKFNKFTSKERGGFIEYYRDTQYDYE